MDCCEFCLKLPNQKISLRVQYRFRGTACIFKPNYYMYAYTYKLFFQEQVLDTVVLLIWPMFEFIGLSRWYNFILKKSLKTYFKFQQSQFCVNTDEVRKRVTSVCHVLLTFDWMKHVIWKVIKFKIIQWIDLLV